VSYLVLDALSPYIGVDAATHWAQLLVISPL